MNIKTWPVELIPITTLKPHPYWERFHRTKPNTISSIANDLDVTGHSPANAICINTKDEVIDGYSSWQGFMIKGLPMVYAMTVDLSWSDEQRFVLARHRNRRHYDDGDLIYFLVNHYRAASRGRPALNGQPCTFSEENPDKKIKIHEIVTLFHSCRTTVNHGISLVKSDDQDLVDEVLNNKRSINSAYNAIKNPKGVDVGFKGLRVKKPIPINEQEATEFVGYLAASNTQSKTAWRFSYSSIS